MSKYDDNASGQRREKFGRPGTTVKSPRKSKPGSGSRPDVLDSAFDPWSLWRTLRAEQFNAQDLQTIRRLLTKTVLLGQPKWEEAARGDAPAAVAVAVSFFPMDEVTVPADLAMTALIRCAIEGDPAAAIVISNVLRNLPGCFAFHRQIATSWSVSNLAQARGSRRDRKPPMISRRPGFGRRP